jgi:RHS repeat-associated protein
VARYHYDPFGNQLSAVGPLADANVYRFSSKELHAASGLVYYLYRYYDAKLQRWINRDPVQEKGSLNLFQFTRNSPGNALDPWGTANLVGIFVGIAVFAVVVGGVVYYFCIRDSCLDQVEATLFTAEGVVNAEFAGEEQHDDEGSQADAVTHCVGACELARNPPPGCGGSLGALQTANNREGQLPPNVMDVANNNEGYDLGTNPANAGTPCLSLCLDRLDAGGLWTFRGGGGDIVPAPPRR